MLVALVMASVGAILVVTATGLAYGTRMPDRPLGVVAVFLLVTAVFAVIGILLGTALPTARAAQGTGTLLFFVMLLLGGAGPPPEVMSPTMRHIADVLPLTHSIRLLQDPWLGLGWSWSALAALIGFLVVPGRARAAPVSVGVRRRSLRHGRSPKDRSIAPSPCSDAKGPGGLVPARPPRGILPRAPRRAYGEP
jgi:ABC-2 type transport system permease protein